VSKFVYLKTLTRTVAHNMDRQQPTSAGNADCLSVLPLRDQKTMT